MTITNTAKILIADDDKDTLDAVAAFLRDSGFEVFTASDGQEALRQVEVQFPDLMLLDLRMPGLGGTDVLAELRTHPRSHPLPVLVLTGSFSLEESLKVTALGAVDYITKPFSNADLLGRIRTHLTAA